MAGRTLLKSNGVSFKRCSTLPMVAQMANSPLRLKICRTVMKS
jgi:hypothetical protein